SDSKFTLSALMGPQDANRHGNVHGGVIMKMVDEAGALVAMRHANAPVVTVTIDSMTFLQPIFLGNLVLCNAELTYVGRTSMEVYIEVVAENPLENTSNVTNSAYAVYVALDNEGRPAPVPPLIYETDAERANASAAQARQEYRKQQKAAHIARQESGTKP
ncbi:MAG: acyl-CoA thioesterase, partial [Burkholderiales bacterium]|nr:acyl-CoA thioesterase [Anaerolineae bacterium]